MVILMSSEAKITFIWSCLVVPDQHAQCWIQYVNLVAMLLRICSDGGKGGDHVRN